MKVGSIAMPRDNEITVNRQLWPDENTHPEFFLTTKLAKRMFS